MQALAALQLADWLQDKNRAQPQLLDVREPWEYAVCHLPGSVLMPLADLTRRWQELDDTQPLVCICHHGQRSLQAALFLQAQGFANIYNLSGGLHGWSTQVDPNLPQY